MDNPPPKDSAPTAETTRQLERWLTSLIAGHPGATTTYTFYEELDAYLGPWGKAGYPVGYGKKYNVLFSTNQKLLADPTAKNWVWRTGVILQEALRDFVVERYRAGTLGTLTEPELRKAAFDSHPRAYTQAGLTLVSILAPELLPEIAMIPAVEFSPNSPNFRATVGQVGETVGIVVPQGIATFLSVLAGPAHTGSWRRAHQRDLSRMDEERRMWQWLHRTETDVTSGRLDHVGKLRNVIHQLNDREFPDPNARKKARRIIAAARSRMCLVTHRYNSSIQSGQDLREVYDRIDPGWSRVTCETN